MYRKIMMLIVGIAFAVPLAPAQTLFARPLATPVEPVEWCWGDCGGNNISFDLTVCFQAQIGIDLNREEESCQVLTGRECQARCTPEAVASNCALTLGADAQPRSLAMCGAEQLDLCREQCDSGGAGFCAVRWNDEHDAIVYVNVNICLDLDTRA